MDRTVRYHLIPDDEVEIPAIMVPVANRVVNIPAETNSPAVPNMVEIPIGDPPAFAETDSTVVTPGNSSTDDSSAEPPKYSYSAPPTYNIATELPSYDEVQRMKLDEEQRRMDQGTRECLASDPFAGEDGLLGTDLTFLSAFFVSFLFNWVGFLLLMCFCHTIAGRYGGLAGFGLSLAKWTLIVKHSTDLINQENVWLGWLVLAFGLLICVRSILQYVHIKREWRLLTRTAQERLLYFY